jgi:hypothetical protein
VGLLVFGSVYTCAWGGGLLECLPTNGEHEYKNGREFATVPHDLLQHTLQFLEAQHDALNEDHHASWEEDPPAPVAVLFESVFAFCTFDVESLTVLTQAPCPAARAHSTLLP